LAAQLAYYKERFDTRINTTKQLWINLNKMCSLCKPKSKINIDKLTIDNKDITERKSAIGKISINTTHRAVPRR